MSSTELQVVSPRADNTYSGKTLAVDDRAHTVSMWRRTPLSYYHPRADAVIADVVEDTFTHKTWPMCSGGEEIATVDVLCDSAAKLQDVIDHLLARDREFRRLEEKYGFYFDEWRRHEKQEAEKKFMEAAREDNVT